MRAAANDRSFTRVRAARKFAAKDVVLIKVVADHHREHETDTDQHERELIGAEMQEGTLKKVNSASIELNNLKEINNRLNYLFSLELSLKSREDENRQYLDRIQRAEDKWGYAEKKLEKIRDLLSGEQLGRLQKLYKKGQI